MQNYASLLNQIQEEVSNLDPGDNTDKVVYVDENRVVSWKSVSEIVPVITGNANEVAKFNSVGEYTPGLLAPSNVFYSNSYSAGKVLGQDGSGNFSWQSSSSDYSGITNWPSTNQNIVFADGSWGKLINEQITDNIIQQPKIVYNETKHYYVASNGTNSSAYGKSAAKPWQTITYAIANVTGTNNCIHLLSSSFSEDIVFTAKSQICIMADAGVANSTACVLYPQTQPLTIDASSFSVKLNNITIDTVSKNFSSMLISGATVFLQNIDVSTKSGQLAIDIRQSCSYLQINQCNIPGTVQPTQNSTSGASIVLAYNASSLGTWSCSYTGWGFFLKSSQIGSLLNSQSSTFIYESQITNSLVFSSPSPQFLFLHGMTGFNVATLSRATVTKSGTSFYYYDSSSIFDTTTSSFSGTRLWYINPTVAFADIGSWPQSYPTTKLIFADGSNDLINMLSFTSANSIANDFANNSYLYYRCWRVDAETYQFAFETADQVISHLSNNTIPGNALANGNTGIIDNNALYMKISGIWTLGKINDYWSNVKSAGNFITVGDMQTQSGATPSADQVLAYDSVNAKFKWISGGSGFSVSGTPSVTSFIGYNDVSATPTWRNSQTYPFVYTASLNYGSFGGSGNPALHMIPIYLNGTNFYWDKISANSLKTSNSVLNNRALCYSTGTSSLVWSLPLLNNNCTFASGAGNVFGFSYTFEQPTYWRTFYPQYNNGSTSGYTEQQGLSLNGVSVSGGAKFSTQPQLCVRDEFSSGTASYAYIMKGISSLQYGGNIASVNGLIAYACFNDIDGESTVLNTKPSAYCYISIASGVVYASSISKKQVMKTLTAENNLTAYNQVKNIQIIKYRYNVYDQLLQDAIASNDHDSQARLAIKASKLVYGYSAENLESLNVRCTTNQVEKSICNEFLSKCGISEQARQKVDQIIQEETLQNQTDKMLAEQKITTLLVSALQAAMSKIETLEARLNAANIP